MTKQLTRSEVRANREKAFAFLQQPELVKAQGVLERKDTINGEHKGRCCLGHMCVAMGIESRLTESGYVSFGDGHLYYAPPQLITAIGLKNKSGDIAPDETQPKTKLPSGYRSLSLWNDGEMLVTPQEIGRHCATLIEGGEGTPFVALSEYPETVDASLSA